jgi:hypothetical protein
VCCRSPVLGAPVNEGNYSWTGAQVTSFAPGDSDFRPLRISARPSIGLGDVHAVNQGMNI